MLSRSLHASTVGRSASMRRMRRMAGAGGRLYCSTNGCTSYLELRPEAHEAICPVCGYRRRLG